MRSKLGDISSILYGKSPAEVLDMDGVFPIIGTGGEYGRASKSMFDAGIVVPRKGSLGNPQLALEPFWATDTTFVVLPSKETDGRWLYYCLLNYDLSKLNEATGVPSISRDWLTKIMLFNPGGDKQSKIADILQSIDRAIEKTETLIDKYQQIKQGLMHDLFTRGIAADGKLRPPRSKAPELYKKTPIGWIPNEWTTAFLENLLANIPNNMRSGPFGSSLLKSELVENGIPFLGIDNIFPEQFRKVYKRFVSKQKFIQLNQYAVRPKDVIITIMGTVGRCAVAPIDIGYALSSKHLWTMTFDQQKILPELICWQLNHASWVKAWFRRETQGGIMDAIRSTTLKTLQLPIPRLDEQKKISQRYNAINKKINAEANFLNKLQKQKSGLMHDLLTGRVEVKANEDEAHHA